MGVEPEEFIATVVHVWRMRDGKVVSCTEFVDTARPLQALGQAVPSAA